MVTFEQLPRGFFRIRGVDGVFYKQGNTCYVSFGEYGYQVNYNFVETFTVAIFWSVSII